MSSGVYERNPEAERLQKLLTEAFQCLRENGIAGVATLPEGIRKLAARSAPEPSEQHQQALDRACYVIMELMQAYERRIRSDCATPEQLASKPWECAEYIKAERFLKAIWKDGRAQPFAALDEFLGYLRSAPEPRDEPLPPCSTCGGETVPFCTSCGYTTTKPAEYPAYTECQHDHMKPNPTLRATYPKHGSQSGWVQEYRCNVCQCSFERPIATAGLRANGETP